MAVASTRWVCLNTQPSAPYGLYWLHRVPSTVERGTLVVAPVPVAVQAWAHAKLLKPVGGVAGDHACILAQRFAINDTDYGPVLTEAHGKPLPQWWGCTVVREEEVFLASPTPRSLDSRYFSGIPIRALTAVATPLLTWR